MGRIKVKRDYKKGRKGSIELSFSMIFSIILIIAILAVAFYVISYFIGLQRCTQISLFYDEFQQKINKAWVSEITQERLELKIPASIEEVCFGDLNFANKRSPEYIDMDRYLGENLNIFLYPGAKACDREFDSAKIEHVNIEGFFCVDAEEGNVEVKISKKSTDALVNVVE